MFKKPFRVSQSSDLKSSVKRKIQTKLKEQFKNVSDVIIWDNVLFPTKNNISVDPSDSSSETIPVQIQCVKIELADAATTTATTTQKDDSHSLKALKSLPLSKQTIHTVKQTKMLQQQQKATSKSNKNATTANNTNSNSNNATFSQKLNMYTVNNVPMFIELSEDEYMPTLFALHAVPQLMTPIIIHSNVSHFILAGADLMLPGLSINIQPEFSSNELCSLFVGGNPYPIAVGRMTFSHKKNEPKPNNGKGKAMIITHMFNDSLWQYGLTNNGHLSAPEGFYSDVVEAIAREEETSQSEQVSSSDEQGTSTDGSTTDGSQVESSDKNTNAQIDQSTTQAPDQQTSKNDDQDHEEEEEVVSEKVMDDRMVYWFMETIKFHMNDDELPMDTSAIYSRMTTVIDKREFVDVKKSSFKKLSKFMKHVTQLKYIKTKDSGKVIVSINRSHPAYLKHEAAKPVKRADNPQSGTNNVSAKSKKQKRKVTVTNLYKPTNPLKPIFIDTTDELFTEAEVRQHLMNYIERNKLRAGMDNFPVQLDELLYGQLFHSKKVEPQYQQGSPAPYQIVLKKLLEKMNGHHMIEFVIPKSDSSAEEPETYTTLHKGACKGISIDIDKVMGNKSGTRINGLAPFLNSTPPPKASNTPLECPQFHDFIKALKTKVSTGIKTNTDLAPNHDPKKEPEVFMQGNNAKIVQELLVNDYGIPQSLVHVTDNTSKKKKR